jgi:hypothetical protein
VEVLAVAIPFQPLVERLIGLSFGKRLADPEAAHGGVRFAFRRRESADPSGAAIVGAMATEDVMHAIDQAQGEFGRVRGSGRAMEPEKIADRERIGPEIALRRAIGGQTGAIREARHQLEGLVLARHGYNLARLDVATTLTLGRCACLPRAIAPPSLVVDGLAFRGCGTPSHRRGGQHRASRQARHSFGDAPHPRHHWPAPREGRTDAERFGSGRAGEFPSPENGRTGLREGGKSGDPVRSESPVLGASPSLAHSVNYLTAPSHDPVAATTMMGGTEE